MNRTLTIRLWLAMAALTCTATSRLDAQTIEDSATRIAQIVAHRGASAERPECTLSAIRQAIEVGATAVELDVRTSRDGQLFILHDATLDRTTDGKGPASKLTLHELQELDAGSWFDARYRNEKVPSLIEAARECRGKIDLLLDLKEQGDEYDQKVVAVIQEHGDPQKTIVGVRSVEQARRFRRLLPGSRQLALIPSVDSIEAFAAAGSETIRLWPRWLTEDDSPAQRVRATGKQLHLNGTLGEFAETIALLKYRPESLSSDDPGRLRRTLQRIADGDTPQQRLAGLVEVVDGPELQPGETDMSARTFLNRDYRMLKIPSELIGLPRYAFHGGEGDRVQLRFRQPGVVFAAFEYNDTGLWSFANGRSPEDSGWHLWRRNAYRGTSNEQLKGGDHFASIWFREFRSDQQLSGLPRWWVCLGLVDVPTAKTIKGFRAGLTSDIPTSAPRFEHSSVAARPRPLHLPEFSTTAEFTRWQEHQREQFMSRMLYRYEGMPRIVTGKITEQAGHRRQEFAVTVNGQRLFRFFRLEPSSGGKHRRLPTVVCFMGHGKVRQILEDRDSYQHACAARFAEAGYLVYAMENIGMEPEHDAHLDLDQSLRLEGYGWYSLLFAHQQILLDHVFEDPHVDTQRVAATGVSTGGLLALTAAVIEPRVSAASIQGIYGSMRVGFIRDRHRHCTCGAIPGLLPEFDLPELSLLIAPRPLHISNGRTDGFSPDEARRCIDLVAPHYRRAGGPPLLLTVSPGGHEYAVEPALSFFNEKLNHTQ